MNIVILLGRGIEGCGVTVFGLEQNAWFNANGHKSKVIATKDKSWTRKNAHDIGDTQVLKFKDPAVVESVIRQCNEADVVYIDSLPSVGHPEECIAGFSKVLDGIKKPIASIQLDHRMASIRRNACLDQVIQKSSMFFVHSTRADFSVYAKELLGYKDIESTSVSLFGDEDEVKRKPFMTFQLGIQFDEMKKYWKPVSEQDVKHHKWIGRTTSWKGYDVMFDFHNKFLRQHGCLTTLEGIEKSPAYLGFVKLSEFIPCIEENAGTYDYSKGYGNLAHVFGPYVKVEALDRMSRCGFGYQLSRLDPKYITCGFETTHCEIAALGVVPVFRKAWGDAAVHRVTGEVMSQIKDTGIIWLDEDDMTLSFELIKKLENDPKMREDWRQKAFEFFKYHHDSKYAFSDIWENTKSHLS